ncbi:Regulatory protein, LuxR:Tetratricopeptide TPR_4 [Burkholderia singularis]|uniref:Regulatory protein, LuxR:Tetratricopeptide TPR_4 n=2 Tax=Burkholderia singularis TaxID=1503053 RepID=A0A238H4I6_9BURK|nr:Regulatory protein, LuxR:Tetratricopeptide TPR_4 [Burkholderia singularis]
MLRSRVCERICHAGMAKLVVVHAPAGFGKTTAMLQSCARFEAEGIGTAWLTLDRADNDAPRFLAGLSRAVARIAGDDDFGTATAHAMEALEHYPAPFVLFFDDFELLQEPAVLDLVREIIDHLPRLGLLVIGSRVLPDLRLGRLRARGQLVEVDAKHLRFSVEETAEFFCRRGMPLAPRALAQLHDKTEGWVAALWLASIALERYATDDESGDFVARFSGSHRAIADYLAEDVLAHQSAEVREFLLRTSILRQLTTPLCQALDPSANCARVLGELEVANVFLTPVQSFSGDTEPAWRYHRLFADFLQAQLHRQHPDEFARLHLLASGWYEAAGRPVPAIDHAIDGGDLPHALNLLAQHAENFLSQGRLRLMARWFAAIPEAALRGHPLLQVIAAWVTCFTQGAGKAMAQLDRSEEWRSDSADVHAHLNALRPLLLAMLDRYEDAYAIGRDSMRRLPSCKPFADSVLINTMASVASVMGESSEAHRLLDAARAGRGTSDFVRAYTEAMEGLLDLQEGQLRQATARLRMVLLSDAHGNGYQHYSGNAWAGVLYASAIYETNQLEEAEHWLNIYLPLARDVSLPDHMIASHSMRARIAFFRGDIDAAVRVLTELEYLGHHRHLPRVVCSARLERAHIFMLQGKAQDAREELERANDPELWARVSHQRLPAHETDDIAIGNLRWNIRFGDAQASLPHIAHELAEAEAGACRRRALKLRVLQAMALQRCGDLSGALQGIAAVLRQACSEGFMRLILDEGDAIGLLLHRLHARRANDGAPHGGDPLFDDYLQRLIAAAGPTPLLEAEAVATALPADVLAEPLTHKETRVLQLLAEGYSNSALAEKLFVCDSTVRTHLRNINMKLGAKNRTQAVAIARKLSIIR